MGDLVLVKLIIGFILSIFFGIFYQYVLIEPYGKFIDKIAPFPYLREGDNYKARTIEEVTIEGYITQFFLMVLLVSFAFLIPFGFSFISFAIVLPLLLPASLLLLRVRIFSEDNILPETGIGYAPMFSFVLCMIGSVGFYMLFPLFYGAKTSSFYIIVIFALASSSVIVPVIPDIINKLLAYDIRTEKGQKLIVYITGALVISLWVFAIAYLIIVGGASPSELVPARYGGG